MKKLAKYTILTTLLINIVVSCELDRYPFDQIEQSQAFKTADDAASLRNGLYSDLREMLNGIYMYTTDVQADMLNATLDFGNRNGFPHRWTGFLADNYTIRDTWRGYYSELVNVNNLINNIGLIETEDASEQADLDIYLGEAHLLRAFYYHQLVLRFAKDYEPSTADTDLGVPLVLDFDVTLLPVRATVEAVYQQIMSDINEAKTYLAPVSGFANADRLTYDAAVALEARVRLCMHDYAGAVAAANLLINAGAYPLITDATELKAMWRDDESTEVIFQFPLSAPNELGNTNAIYLRYQAALDKYAPDFVPQQWVIDMYEDVDIRKNVYLEQKPVIIQGIDYPGIWLINKYPGNPDLFEAATTNYQQQPKVFRVAEMYLISAEAAAQNPATEGDALSTLNELRLARGLNALTGLTGTALMDAIKEERTREMLCEGTRLDDLKRWHMGFSRSTPQNMDLIETGPDYEQKTVTADDDKFVWGIPQNDITTNPNLAGQQNPGW